MTSSTPTAGGRRRLVVLLAAAAALAVLVLVVWVSRSPEPSCDRLPGVRAGVCLTEPGERRAAPTDAVAVIGDPDRVISLEDLAGRVVVVNFWASWCGPCRSEQPVLNDAFATLPEDEVAFLGVAVQDSEANALAHEREFAIPYRSVADPASSFAARFGGVGPRALPTTILIDREGRVAARLFGEVRDPQEVVTLATLLLDE